MGSADAARRNPRQGDEVNLGCFCRNVRFASQQSRSLWSETRLLPGPLGRRSFAFLSTATPDGRAPPSILLRFPEPKRGIHHRDRGRKGFARRFRDSGFFVHAAQAPPRPWSRFFLLLSFGHLELFDLEASVGCARMRKMRCRARLTSGRNLMPSSPRAVCPVGSARLIFHDSTRSLHRKARRAPRHRA